MPRINHVKKARKDQRPCESCGQPIEAGQGYKWVKSRYGPKRSRHSTCPSWQPSELTGSEFLSLLYSAQENVEEVLANWDPSDGLEELTQALEDAAQQAEDAAELRRESAANIEDGFGVRTYQCDDLEAEGDEAEDWGRQLSDALDSVNQEPPEGPEDEGDDTEREAYEAELEQWADDIRYAVEDAIGSCPF